MDLPDEDIVQTQTPDLSDSRKTDQILEDQYKELFGEEYLKEDIILLNNPPNNIQLRTCKITPEEQSIAFKKAMADYKREQEASITKYNFEPSIQFPTTMQCIKLEKEQTKPQEDEEEVIEIHITEEEQEVITEHVEPIAAGLLPIADKEGEEQEGTPASRTLSNRKMKKANWAHQQRQARKIKREIRDQNQ